MRKFRVTVKETITYVKEVPELELARLLGMDIEGVLAGDIEDMWLDDMDGNPHQTVLEETVRMDAQPDLSLPEYHLEEI